MFSVILRYLLSQGSFGLPSRSNKSQRLLIQSMTTGPVGLVLKRTRQAQPCQTPTVPLRADSALLLPDGAFSVWVKM